MSENTKIEWCDATFNPWIGCTKVSPGCANCYAEFQTPARVQRSKGRELWGKGQPRMRASAATWKQPLKWNRHGLSNFRCAECGNGICTCGHAVSLAPGVGRRPRVFCGSCCDWLDDEVPVEWRKDLLRLIRETPYLDWLLLTKRPENFERLLLEVWENTEEALEGAADWIFEWATQGVFPENVWILGTVENQPMADKRIAEILKIPAKIHGLSCEPLLEEIDLPVFINPTGASIGVDWVICGGESGRKSQPIRPMHPDWARSLRDQCAEAGVPFLFKQWGDHRHCDEMPMEMYAAACEKAKHVSGPGNGYFRVGKKIAGRLLDGREHNEFPEVR